MLVTELRGCVWYVLCYVMSRFKHAREQRESKRGTCLLAACCLDCQYPVSCYFYFVLLHLGPELW